MLLAPGLCARSLHQTNFIIIDKFFRLFQLALLVYRLVCKFHLLKKNKTRDKACTFLALASVDLFLVFFSQTTALQNLLIVLSRMFALDQWFPSCGHLSKMFHLGQWFPSCGTLIRIFDLDQWFQSCGPLSRMLHFDQWFPRCGSLSRMFDLDQWFLSCSSLAEYV